MFRVLKKYEAIHIIAILIAVFCSFVAFLLAIFFYQPIKNKKYSPLEEEKLSHKTSTIKRVM